MLVARRGRILGMVAGWEEQPIAFTAQLRGWLTDLAELQKHSKGHVVLLSLVLHIRCECPDLELEERPTPL